MFIYNKPGIPCIWNNLLERPNQQTENRDHIWNAHQQTQIWNTHLWKTHLEQNFGTNIWSTPFASVLDVPTSEQRVLPSLRPQA